MKVSASTTLTVTPRGKDAVVYQLVSSHTSAKRLDVDGSGNGSPVPASVSCRVTRQKGEDTPVTVSDLAAEGLSMTYTYSLDSSRPPASERSYNPLDAVAVPSSKACHSIVFKLYRHDVLIQSVSVGIISDGAPAYALSVSPQTVSFVKNGKRQRLSVYVDLNVGGEAVAYNGSGTNPDGFTCSVLSESGPGPLADGLQWGFSVDADGRFYYILVYSGSAALSMMIPFTATHKGHSIEGKISVTTTDKPEKGDRGDRGPALRGPRMWDECPVGCDFQNGDVGCDFIDVVYHRGNFFQCATSHKKTADKYPLGSVSEAGDLWKLGTDFDLVATRLLLAQYILVKNLGVENVDIRDDAGNILFHADRNGLTCRMGSFENVVISGFMKKTRTVVNASNFNDIFIPKGDAADAAYSIDFTRCGTWLDISYLPADVSVYPDNIRALAGNTILLYNNSAHSLAFSAKSCVNYNGTPGSFSSFAIAPGKFAALECKIGAYQGKETAFFAAQHGSTDPSLDI